MGPLPPFLGAGDSRRPVWHCPRLLGIGVFLQAVESFGTTSGKAALAGGESKRSVKAMKFELYTEEDREASVALSGATWLNWRQSQRWRGAQARSHGSCYRRRENVANRPA